MAYTYTQLHIHIVFAVKKRKPLISPVWENRLHKYITGIIQQKGHKLIIINGMPDHIHILIGFRPSLSLSSLIRDIKCDSSLWINHEQLSPILFHWQEGYGAFAVSNSHISRVATYIENQKTHHQKTKYPDEYRKLLTENQVNFDEKYFLEPEV